MQQRLLHIDVAKGISIFLVALFHSQFHYYFLTVIEPMSLVRMPLFFLLSGIFFSYTAAPTTFFWHKFDALLKPYFVVLLSVFVVNYAYSNGGGITEFIGIFWGTGDSIVWGPMWFLTHLFALYCFVYLIFRYAHFGALPRFAQFSILACSMALGISTMTVFWYPDVVVFGATIRPPGLPFSLDILPVTAGFFILGFLFKENLKTFKPSPGLLLLASVVLLVIVWQTDAHIDFNERELRGATYAVVAAFCGIYVVLGLAWGLAQRKWLRAVPLIFGRASLYILIFHSPILKLTYPFLRGHLSALLHPWIIAGIALALCLLIPVAIQRVVIRSNVLKLAFVPLRENPLAERLRARPPFLRRKSNVRGS